MDKQVIVVGGIHGAGKTTCIQALGYEVGCETAKQIKMVVEIGNEQGLQDWRAILTRLDEFIIPAANLLVKRFLDSQYPILLIDSHYAIATTKALRLKGKTVKSDFIPDLDYRFVEVLTNNFKIRFVLLDANPEIACQRTACRPEEVLDFFNTLEGLKQIQKAEKFFFQQILKKFQVAESDSMAIDANQNFPTVLSHLKNFILT